MDDWVEQFSSSKQRPYWKSKTNGSTTWTDPRASAATTTAQASTNLPFRDESTISSSTSVVVEHSDDTNWIECFSQSKQRKYWKNSKTGESTWSSPHTATIENAAPLSSSLISTSSSKAIASDADTNSSNPTSILKEDSSVTVTNAFISGGDGGSELGKDDSSQGGADNISELVLSSHGNNDNEKEEEKEEDNRSETNNSVVSSSSNYDEWKASYSDKHKRKYWKNKVTGEILWSNPKKQRPASLKVAASSASTSTSSVRDNERNEEVQEAINTPAKVPVPPPISPPPAIQTKFSENPPPQPRPPSHPPPPPSEALKSASIKSPMSNRRNSVIKSDGSLTYSTLVFINRQCKTKDSNLALRSELNYVTPYNLDIEITKVVQLGKANQKNAEGSVSLIFKSTAIANSSNTTGIKIPITIETEIIACKPSTCDVTITFKKENVDKALAGMINFLLYNDTSSFSSKSRDRYVLVFTCYSPYAAHGIVNELNHHLDILRDEMHEEVRLRSSSENRSSDSKTIENKNISFKKVDPSSIFFPHSLEIQRANLMANVLQISTIDCSDAKDRIFACMKSREEKLVLNKDANSIQSSRLTFPDSVDYIESTSSRGKEVASNISIVVFKLDNIDDSKRRLHYGRLIPGDLAGVTLAESVCGKSKTTIYKSIPSSQNVGGERAEVKKGVTSSSPNRDLHGEQNKSTWSSAICKFDFERSMLLLFCNNNAVPSHSIKCNGCSDIIFPSNYLNCKYLEFGLLIGVGSKINNSIRDKSAFNKASGEKLIRFKFDSVKEYLSYLHCISLLTLPFQTSFSNNETLDSSSRVPLIINRDLLNSTSLSAVMQNALLICSSRSLMQNIGQVRICNSSDDSSGEKTDLLNLSKLQLSCQNGRLICSIDRRFSSGMSMSSCSVVLGVNNVTVNNINSDSLLQLVDASRNTSSIYNIQNVNRTELLYVNFSEVLVRVKIFIDKVILPNQDVSYDRFNSQSSSSKSESSNSSHNNLSGNSNSNSNGNIDSDRSLSKLNTWIEGIILILNGKLHLILDQNPFLSKSESSALVGGNRNVSNNGKLSLSCPISEFKYQINTNLNCNLFELQRKLSSSSNIGAHLSNQGLLTLQISSKDFQVQVYHENYLKLIDIITDVAKSQTLANIPVNNSLKAGSFDEVSANLVGCYSQSFKIYDLCELIHVNKMFSSGQLASSDDLAYYLNGSGAAIGSSKTASNVPNTSSSAISCASRKVTAGERPEKLKYDLLTICDKLQKLLHQYDSDLSSKLFLNARLGNDDTSGRSERSLWMNLTDQNNIIDRYESFIVEYMNNQLLFAKLLSSEMSHSKQYITTSKQNRTDNSDRKKDSAGSLEFSDAGDSNQTIALGSSSSLSSVLASSGNGTESSTIGGSENKISEAGKSSLDYSVSIAGNVTAPIANEVKSTPVASSNRRRSSLLDLKAAVKAADLSTSMQSGALEPPQIELNSVATETENSKENIVLDLVESLLPEDKSGGASSNSQENADKMPASEDQTTERPERSRNSLKNFAGSIKSLGKSMKEMKKKVIEKQNTSQESLLSIQDPDEFIGFLPPNDCYALAQFVNILKSDPSFIINIFSTLTEQKDVATFMNIIVHRLFSCFTIENLFQISFPSLVSEQNCNESSEYSLSNTSEAKLSNILVAIIDHDKSFSLLSNKKYSDTSSNSVDASNFIKTVVQDRVNFLPNSVFSSSYENINFHLKTGSVGIRIEGETAIAKAGVGLQAPGGMPVDSNTGTRSKCELLSVFLEEISERFDVVNYIRYICQDHLLLTLKDLTRQRENFNNNLPSGNNRVHVGIICDKFIEPIVSRLILSIENCSIPSIIITAISDLSKYHNIDFSDIEDSFSTNYLQSKTMYFLWLLIHSFIKKSIHAYLGIVSTKSIELDELLSHEKLLQELDLRLEKSSFGPSLMGFGILNNRRSANNNNNNGMKKNEDIESLLKRSKDDDTYISMVNIWSIFQECIFVWSGLTSKSIISPRLNTGIPLTSLSLLEVATIQRCQRSILRFFILCKESSRNYRHTITFANDAKSDSSAPKKKCDIAVDGSTIFPPNELIFLLNKCLHSLEGSTFSRSVSQPKSSTSSWIGFNSIYARADDLSNDSANPATFTTSTTSTPSVAPFASALAASTKSNATNSQSVTVSQKCLAHLSTIKFSLLYILREYNLKHKVVVVTSPKYYATIKSRNTMPNESRENEVNLQKFIDSPAKSLSILQTQLASISWAINSGKCMLSVLKESIFSNPQVNIESNSSNPVLNVDFNSRFLKTCILEVSNLHETLLQSNQMVWNVINAYSYLSYLEKSNCNLGNQLKILIDLRTHKVGKDLIRLDLLKVLKKGGYVPDLGDDEEGFELCNLVNFGYSCDDGRILEFSKLAIRRNQRIAAAYRYHSNYAGNSGYFSTPAPYSHHNNAHDVNNQYQQQSYQDSGPNSDFDYLRAPASDIVGNASTGFEISRNDNVLLSLILQKFQRDSLMNYEKFFAKVHSSLKYFFASHSVSTEHEVLLIKSKTDSKSTTKSVDNYTDGRKSSVGLLNDNANAGANTNCVVDNHNIADTAADKENNYSADFSSNIIKVANDPSLSTAAVDSSSRSAQEPLLFTSKLMQAPNSRSLELLLKMAKISIPADPSLSISTISSHNAPSVDLNKKTVENSLHFAIKNVESARESL